MRCVCFVMLLLCSFIANAGLVADYLFNHSLDTDFPQAVSLQYVGGTPVYTQVQITGQPQTVLEVELLSGDRKSVV